MQDIGTLQQMVKMQSMVEDEGFHDNVSHVLLDQSKGDNMEEGEEELIQALEDKYDALKDKLIEAVSDWYTVLKPPTVFYLYVHVDLNQLLYSQRLYFVINQELIGSRQPTFATKPYLHPC